MNLKLFSHTKFISALKLLFKELNVPINYVTDEPTSAKEILKDTYKDNETFRLIDNVYFVGMVDDAAFEGNKSLSIEKIKSDYDGILIFGITLKGRPNGLLPTRSQLAEISRSFNREFYYTPVTIVFKYGHHMAFANTERMKYRQEWREGEKAGKVILLRDIDIEKPHSGHERILSELKVPTSGKESVTNFEQLYIYWHKVFNVSLLNKKFYEELSNWYFWATKQVIFPGAPTNTDAYRKKAKLDDLLQEHNATNVIRMLTRLLFVWFIKEKKLIPDDLFELETLQKDILKEISPFHEKGMFKEANKESVYYKAILQNLFFATLNCPIEGDSLDKRKRGFRGDGYGTHRGIDYLMRYKQYFKNPDKFLEKVNAVVPFLNGGLFECLDDKYSNIYIDGFSDQMTQGENLVVPDYLFFGVEEKVDLSKDYGISNKGTKEAAVKGLINILKSYKFTITENTPIEEDVALDPELLGKVFENLLASYNPETQTTARKQTGSFYTPREIVNYMVDESLIAYLKNSIINWGLSEDDTNKELHILTSYDSKVPFEKNKPLQKQIVEALSKCTILDPACGSGAFPMGALQKMVHILQKLDPDNKLWKQVNLQKAEEDSKAAFEIEDKLAREERLLEINEAFDQNTNNPDYARKLFLIENCIYGVDIQPIAAQISKLRFFISLVVEQKVNHERENFGIRPLPNLETKFVTANTLIDIDKPKVGETINIFSGGKVDELEKELKKIRSRLFSARTKETKLKYRRKDLELRTEIAQELKSSGWPNNAADKLAKWDPYDQNASSTFFNSEWMFDVKKGFDIVIGNPPYGAKFNEEEKLYFKTNYKHQDYQPESFLFFTEKSFDFLNSNGILSLIIPNTWLTNLKLVKIRKFLTSNNFILNISHYHKSVFDAVVDTEVVIFGKGYNENNIVTVYNHIDEGVVDFICHNQTKWKDKNGDVINIFSNEKTERIIEIFKTNSKELSNYCDSFSGVKPYEIGKGSPQQTKEMVKDRVYDAQEKLNNSYRKLIRGSDINKYENNWNGKRWIKYGENLAAQRKPEIFSKNKIIIRQTGDSLIATFDTDKFICLNNTHVITEKNRINLKFILALLNSSSLNFYFQYLNPEAGEALAEVKKETVEKLLVKLPKDETPFIKIVDYLLFIKKTKSNQVSFFFENLLNAMVYELYLESQLRKAGCEVIKYLDAIPELKEEWDDNIKLNKIEHMYNELSNPTHPVSIAMAKMLEIEEVKIIEGR